MIDAIQSAARLLPVVAVALVDERGRVLLAKRPEGAVHADLWEFPGGKIEPGERPEDALVRELREELGITVIAQDVFPIGFASLPLGERHLLLLLYRADRWAGEPVPLVARALAWFEASDMSKLAMPPADRQLTDMVARSIGEVAGVRT